MSEADGLVCPGTVGDELALLSVIIPCRNAERYVGRQLDAVASQNTSFPWELVLVDNGSTDRSVQIAETYADRVQLRIVPAPDRANQAYARNVGAKAAFADKLVFIDADDEVAPGFLASMFATLEEHDFVASPRDMDSLNPAWIRDAHDVPESAYGAFSPFAFGSAMGLSRRVFQSVGGCPEEYAACEDMALSFRLRRAGVALVFLPEPLHRYRFRSSIRGLFNQTRVWGYHEALVYREFREPLVPARSASLARSEWSSALRELIAARSRADLARCAVRLGYSTGRLQGSLRHRVFYP
jgi:glycosyltransferase involved in cell wall biosynthesis